VGYAAKQLFTDPSFYHYGHYRADAVAEAMAKEPVYQTPAYCRDCHGERHAQWSAGNHKTVSCETCHGAAQGHPEKGKLPIPASTAQLCTLCHEAMPGRPATQPQIGPAKHAGNQQCAACHNPHAPKLAGLAAPVTGDVAAGKKAAAACASCHGAEGVSPNDTWPNLAGQHPAYLARILAAYKSGDQKDVAMTPFAQALGDADIQNLAAYYGGLACESAAGTARGDPALGKALANNCSACHGETGIAANPAWPSIAGQQPGYLVNVLKAFRAGLRKDPMMAGVTRALSDADIENLAAYYSRQSCRPPAQAKAKP
jgi:cytochrome c553